MAGLVPAIHVRQHAIMHGGWVYILASAANGILYVGVTSDIVRRIYEHRNGLVPGFTKKYGVKLLVYSSAMKISRPQSNASTTSSIGHGRGRSG